MHDDFSGFGEFHGIADEIGEDLPETSRIASHPRRKVRARHVRQLEALAVGALGEQLEHVFHCDA